MAVDKLAAFDWALDAAGAPAGQFGQIGTILCTNSYDTFAADANWPQSLSSPASSGPAGFGGVVGRPIIHDVGRGKPVFLNVQIVKTMVGAGATMEVDFISDSDPALATTKQVHIASPAVAVAALVAGYAFPFKTLPKKVTQRYIGVQYVISVAAFTAGQISAWLSADAGSENADIIGGAP